MLYVSLAGYKRDLLPVLDTVKCVYFAAHFLPGFVINTVVVPFELCTGDLTAGMCIPCSNDNLHSSVNKF
jgi:hypothetical protein